MAGSSPAMASKKGGMRRPGLSRRALDPPHLARDRAGIADRLHKMHAVAYLQLVEIALHQAVAVEIELRPLMRQHKAVILVRVELRDLAGEERIVLMHLHLAALLALELHQAPLGGLDR